MMDPNTESRARQIQDMEDKVDGWGLYAPMDGAVYTVDDAERWVCLWCRRCVVDESHLGGTRHKSSMRNHAQFHVQWFDVGVPRNPFLAQSSSSNRDTAGRVAFPGEYGRVRVNWAPGVVRQQHVQPASGWSAWNPCAGAQAALPAPPPPSAPPPPAWPKPPPPAVPLSPTVSEEAFNKLKNESDEQAQQISALEDQVEQLQAIAEKLSEKADEQAKQIQTMLESIENQAKAIRDLEEVVKEQGENIDGWWDWYNAPYQPWQ